MTADDADVPDEPGTGESGAGESGAGARASVAESAAAQHSDGQISDEQTAAGEPPLPTIAPSALRAATEGRVSDDHDGAASGAVIDEEGREAVADVDADDGDADGVDGDADGVDGVDGVKADLDIDEEVDEDEDDEDRQAWRAVPLTTRLEALLFAATRPLGLRRLQSLAGDAAAADVRDAIDSLQAHYEATSRAFCIEEIGEGYQLRTRASLSGLLARLGHKRAGDKLSPAAVETLAIVAYRQPVLRADVEKIRGVASGEILRTLVEKGVVRVAGRADLPGAPLLYGTTPAFLELFGLRDLRELPNDRELLRSS